MADFPLAITQMIDAKRLECVATNIAHAHSVITSARLYVGTARALAETDDVAMAFTAAYDGARKALAAVLAVHGLRVRPMGGAHRNTGVAAAAMMPSGSEVIAEFEWMRQIRNATEYPDDARLGATLQDVREAIAASDAIVAVCAAAIAAISES